MKIKIEDAKGYQLREFATKVLGLDVKGTESLASVRAKIAAAWEGDEIEVSEPEAPTVRKISAPASKAEPAEDDGSRKVTIIIQKSSMPGGSRPVFAAVNGRGIWIPRGEPVVIAEKYLHVLENAKEAQYDQLPDGGINPVPRMVPKYPYQRVA
jgi:hypothetical protein